MLLLIDILNAAAALIDRCVVWRLSRFQSSRPGPDSSLQGTPDARVVKAIRNPR